MSKRVSTLGGPLAPPDNPKPSPSKPSSPTKMVGLFHQYPPIDMVNKETHHVPEGGGGGPSGQVEGTDIISPNELKVLKQAGIHAAVEDAFTLQKHRQEAAARLSPVPPHIREAILNPVSGLSSWKSRLPLSQLMLPRQSSNHSPPLCWKHLVEILIRTPLQRWGQP